MKDLILFPAPQIRRDRPATPSTERRLGGILWEMDTFVVISDQKFTIGRDVRTMTTLPYTIVFRLVRQRKHGKQDIERPGTVTESIGNPGVHAYQ